MPLHISSSIVHAQNPLIHWWEPCFPLCLLLSVRDAFFDDEFSILDILQIKF
jgi:hypothetical protein